MLNSLIPDLCCKIPSMCSFTSMIITLQFPCISVHSVTVSLLSCSRCISDCSSICGTERWRPTLLDTLAWAPRGSSSSPSNLSGMGRAPLRIWRRSPPTSGLASGSRWLMLGSSTSPATPSRTMTRSLTPPPCLALSRNATHGLVGRLGSIPTSRWPGAMPLSLLWK